MAVKKDTAIFLLTNNTLELLTQKNLNTKKIQFTSDIVQNQEIIDKIKFEKTIKEFLIHLITKTAVILLTDDIIYSQIIPRSNPEQEIAEIKIFFSQIPFDEEKIAKKILIEKEIHCFATNREYYVSIESIAKQQGIKVLAVLPITIFGEIYNPTELTKKIDKQSTLIEQSNFLTLNKQEENIFKEKNTDLENEQIEKKSKKDLKQVILLTISFIILLSSIIFALFQLGIVSIPKRTSKRTSSTTRVHVKNIPTIISTEISKKPSLSKTIETNSKTTLKVEILNGSGVAGQATVVKNQLIQNGFENVTTGNSPVQNNQTTTVIFLKSTPDSFRQEITNALNNIFKEVVTNQADNQQFDIIITTGSNTK